MAALHLLLSLSLSLKWAREEKANSLFLGEFMLPDWDMFHSLHPAAEYHGAARAVGGCSIYVSDKPGHHNFELLRKLVLPDGSVLRAQLPGRPTLDSLFNDPARDGRSLLKIWNINKCTGLVGVFNCQGAGWCKEMKKTRIHDIAPGTLTSSVTAQHVDSISKLSGTDWDGQSIVYAYRSGKVIRLPKGDALPVTLKVLEYEIFHFSPLKKITTSVSFAPIGLLDMFNSGGAVESFDVKLCSIVNPDSDDQLSPLSKNRVPTAEVVLRVRGCGRFGAYSSIRPLECSLDSQKVEFSYVADSGLLTVNIPVPEEEMYRWTLEIQI